MWKNRKLWLVAIVAFVAGILTGVLLGGGFSDSGGDQTEAVELKVGSTATNDQQLTMLQQLVITEPDNFSALVRLAHSYFDANRLVEAVQAYSKALKLRPDDADLLTDQGVMFRRLGWYDQAVANFKRAAAVDPHHEQSLYNLGIVYLYDLHQPQQAVAVWQQYLKRVPQGESAESVREEIEQISALKANVAQ